MSINYIDKYYHFHDMPVESLKDKTVKGVTWSAIDNVAGYAVTYVVGIILARLLSPDDFGLF